MSKILSIQEQLENFEKDCFAGSECKRICAAYNLCVEETKNFVKKNKFTDVLIGLSGGIDSSLVAKIAVDAFGSKHVHGLLLPGPYSSQDSLQDAKQLAINLDIKVSTLFINSSYEAIINTLELANVCGEDGKVSDLASQNIQARLRMIMLMAISNQHGYFLLNTANKSEVYTGYSTLYGDMAGMFSPLGDVYKTDVFKMCVYKNLQDKRMNDSKNNIIPQNIINKPPSAELSESQTDEKSLGIDYASLDAILHEYVDNKKNIKDIVFMGFSESMVQSVINKVKRSEFKRRYEPPYANLNY